MNEEIKDMIEITLQTKLKTQGKHASKYINTPGHGFFMHHYPNLDIVRLTEEASIHGLTVGFEDNGQLLTLNWK